MNEQEYMVENSGPMLIAAVQRLEIKSIADLDVAAKLRFSIVDMLKQAHEYFDPEVERWNVGHKAACAKRGGVIKPLEEAKDALSKLISAYTYQQQQAQRQAALAAEAKAREEAENLRQIELAEAKSVEEAAEIESAPLVVAPVAVTPAPVKPAGLKTIVEWRWRLVDAAKVPDEFWLLDEAKISRLVKAMKGETRVPGIEVYDQHRTQG